MINILKKRTLSLNTWQRFIAYIHLVEIEIGWKKKCKIILPLNYIDPRFELLETVHFENYITVTDSSKEGASLLSYIENCLNIIHPIECDYERNLEQIFNLGIPALSSKQPRRSLKESRYVYWREYFPYYEVKGFKRYNWVIQSPYKEELNFPKYLSCTYTHEKNGVKRYQIKDRFAIEDK